MKHTLDSFVIKNSKIKIKMEKKIGKEKKKGVKGDFTGDFYEESSANRFLCGYRLWAI